MNVVLHSRSLGVICSLRSQYIIFYHQKHTGIVFAQYGLKLVKFSLLSIMAVVYFVFFSHLLGAGKEAV
jgi:hypothetical protein